MPIYIHFISNCKFLKIKNCLREPVFFFSKDKVKRHYVP